MRLYDGDTFERRGYTFRVNFERDDAMGKPWEEHDGHGVVREVKLHGERVSKGPGERVLWSDRWTAYLYDVQASMKLARKDGWGCKHSTIVDGKFISGHQHKREALACAVEQDFNYLRGWCNDEWEWTVATVTLCDEDGNAEGGPDTRASLGGIDGDHDGGTYLTEVAKELADDILAHVEVENPDVVLSEN